MTTAVHPLTTDEANQIRDGFLQADHAIDLHLVTDVDGIVHVWPDQALPLLDEITVLRAVLRRTDSPVYWGPPVPPPAIDNQIVWHERESA